MEEHSMFTGEDDDYEYYPPKKSKKLLIFIILFVISVTIILITQFGDKSLKTEIEELLPVKEIIIQQPVSNNTTELLEPTNTTSEPIILETKTINFTQQLKAINSNYITHTTLEINNKTELFVYYYHLPQQNISSDAITLINNIFKIEDVSKITLNYVKERTTIIEKENILARIHITKNNFEKTSNLTIKNLNTYSNLQLKCVMCDHNTEINKINKTIFGSTSLSKALNFYKGQKITITASGTINYDVTKADVTPLGVSISGTWPCNNTKAMSLYGTFTRNYHNCFLIGTSYTFTPEKDGSLLVGVNDVNLTDNTGNWDLKISQETLLENNCECVENIV